uniref:Uncharacterized protein n=1 Tax=Arundo donax TaxID=35708 RepID=A0A0A9DKA5_ARUDO
MYSLDHLPSIHYFNSKPHLENRNALPHITTTNQNSRHNTVKNQYQKRGKTYNRIICNISS